MRPISTFLVSIILLSCSNEVPQSKIDALFLDYTGERPGAAVLVIHHGEKVLESHYGLADLEAGIPVSAATNFRLASVSKQFTATCILQLIAKDSLTLDTKIKEVLPELPSWADSMTYWHLLTHTSGLVDYEHIMADTATVQVHDDDVLELLLTVDSTYFETGSDYAYSNSGYALLALSVERVTGLSYPEYLDKYVFTPAGMANSVAFVKGQNSIPDRAFGYVVDSLGATPRDQSPTSAVLGDGGIYSSLNDMFKWDQALYGSSVLPQDLLKQAFTPNLNDYGYGWRIDEFAGHRRVHHTGSTCGFRSVIERYPDDNLTIIILANRAEPGLMALADQISSIYLQTL